MYKNLCDAINNIQWVQCESIVEKIAAVKDQLEIQSLKTAIEITDEVFTQIIPELKIFQKKKRKL